MVLYRYYKKRNRNSIMTENGELETTEQRPLASTAATGTTTTTTTTIQNTTVNMGVTPSTLEKYREIEEENDDDDFYLNTQNIAPDYHQYQIVKDREFYLIKHNIPLRPKINQIQYRITTEINHLQDIFNELKIRNEQEIKKLVISIKENNIQYSSLISSELTVIRKTSRDIWTTKIVLDDLYTKICTISSFKDLVDTITPLLSVIKNIRSLLIPHIREPDHEFKNIADLLCDIVFNAGQIGGYLINFKLANNRALNILNDALFKAENKIKTEFLPIPNITT
jgi:division protein CdvB (Snf7/Vps24/ESCRT-III family)